MFNTDQGSQFISEALTGVPIEKRYRDQHGWQGRVARQRLRRAHLETAQIRGVYLRAYDEVAEARASIGRYLDFCNTRRPLSILDPHAPDEVYFDHLVRSAAS